MAYLIALDKRFNCSCKECLKVKDCKSKPIAVCYFFKIANQ